MIDSSLRSIRGKREVTRVFYGVDIVINAVIEFLHQTNDFVYACVDQTRPSLTFDISELMKAFKDAKKRGVKLLYITEITKDNLSYCKQLMSMVNELRHLDGIKGNFYISKSRYLAPATFHEKGKSASQIIYSNVKAILEQQHYVFETLWNKSIPAEVKIKELEQGLEPDIIEVIQNPAKTMNLYLELIRGAKKEILLIFPTTNAIIRQNKSGVLQLLKEAAERYKVNVRILIPVIGDLDDNTLAFINHDYSVKDKRVNEENYSNIKRLLLSDAISNNIDIRHIRKTSETEATILVVDRKYSLVIELRDDNESSFEQAIGLSTYSTSRPGVLSYISIFESLWIQTEIYEQLRETNDQLALANEQLKIHDKMQREFINIASHEMKTPTQAILGMSGLLQYYPERRDELIKIIRRNAKRLQSLTSDILDVTRIESQTLKLEKERFNIIDLVSEVVNDNLERTKNNNNNKKKVELLYRRDKIGKHHQIIVEADRGRIIQVLTNLLNNALKFTDEGQIIVSIYQSNDDNENRNEVTVEVVDSGSGIDNEMYPKLFSKFATKSHQGTGLGLFISKSIIEAHRGRIWAKNNTGRRGATFGFTLPILHVDSAVADE
ncbi:MAG TPA: ATP-binding protein [Nitrososphaeraceae archaeon]|nr:ATP-binding protein [Nitrososphaeraceae archaeon]